VDEYFNKGIMNEQLISRKIGISISQAFEEMPTSLVLSNFPIFNRRPQEIYMIDMGRIILSCNQSKDNVTSDELPHYKQNAFDPVFNNPAAINYKSAIINLNGHDVLRMEYSLDQEDGDIRFNSSLVGSLDGKMLVVHFSCPDEEKEDWKPEIDRMFNSVILS
jgi:hypothetical protein